MLSPLDAELARHDAKIIGLPILLNADAFAALLQTRLPELLLETARITYLRYKPETNCLVLYELEAAGKTFDVYATAYERDAANKLEKSRVRPFVDTPFGSGRLVFDEQSIVVSFFPNDSNIKTLLKIADADNRKSLFNQLFPRCPEFQNGVLRKLSYKPERRFVAALEIENEPRATLKFYKAEDYNRAQANARAFHSGDALRLAREIGCSERRGVIAFEWIDGVVLSEAYLDAEFNSEAIETVGASLAELHAQNAVGLVHFTRSAEARMLRELADGIGALCPHLNKRAQTLAARLVDSSFRANAPTRAVHGDFYAEQVLLCQDSAAILDLDEAADGDPTADIGNFIARLEFDYLCGKITKNRAESFGLALLEGYANSAVSGQPSARIENCRVKFYTAVGLFRLAPRPFRYHEPDWSEKIEVILERAEQTFAAAESCRITASANGGNRQKADEQDESPTISVSDPFGIANDSKMPFLARALDSAEVERLFAKHFQPLRDSEEKICLRAIRAFRHKPGRRAVFEYDLEAINSSEEVNPDKTIKSNEAINSNTERTAFTLVGKVRAKGLDEMSFRIQRSLWLDGFDEASADGVSVPEPIALVPELEMWLQRRVPGATAFSRLAEADGIEVARRVAGAIYKLHRTKLPDAAKARRPHTIASELEILKRRLTQVAEMKPQWQKRLTQLFAACEELSQSLDNAEQRMIHRDFYADQVIVSGSRLYLIDFDLLCLGDPALDVGNFLGHIIEQSLRITGDETALLDREKAFENRYVELAGENVRPAIRDYATLTLARHIYLSTQFAERTNWTEKLLEICESRLELY